MELTNEFEVNEVEGQVELIQKVVRRFSYASALLELNKLRNEFVQLDQKLKQTEVAIVNNELEVKRQALIDTKATIGRLIKSLEKVSEKEIEKLKNVIKAKVKVGKADLAYSRTKSKETKVIKQNQILAPILAEYEIDMSHPLAREIKKDFEEI